MTATAPLAPSADTFNALRQKLESQPYEYRGNFTLRSGTPQLGPIPASRTIYVPRLDLMKTLAAQYARAKGPLTQKLILRRYLRLLPTEPSLSWDEFCAQVALLPPGQLWRHNVQGDLPGDPLQLQVDAEPLEQLVRANRDKHGFTFSRFHPKFAQNADLIAHANRQGFTINLEADSLTQADELLHWQVAPVVVRVPEDVPPILRTPAGNKVVVCPQSHRQGVSCAACKLCAQAWYPHQNRDRDIVAFPIPGLRTADLPPDVLAEMM
jgi:hypothetical protein